MQSPNSIRGRRSGITGRRSGLLVAVIVAFALTVAGVTLAASTPPGVATAKALVAQAMKPLTFTASGAPFDMKKNAGKSVWWISPNQSIPAMVANSNSFTQAAKAAGMKVTVFDGRGQVATWNQGVTEAVAQHADAILLQGIDPKLVAGPLKDAVKAGIKVVDSGNGGAHDPVPAGVYGHAAIDPHTYYGLLADYIIAASNGTAHVGIFSDPKYMILREGVAIQMAEFKRLCPGCKVTLQNIDSSQMATQLPATTQTVLRRQPDTTYVLPIFDAMVNFVLQGVRQIGAKVQVVSGDAVPANLDLVRKGQQAADMGLPAEMIGWVEVDLIGRALAGQPPQSEGVPVRLLTKANLPIKYDFASLFGKFNYQAAFKKAWGIS